MNTTFTTGIFYMTSTNVPLPYCLVDSALNKCNFYYYCFIIDAEQALWPKPSHAMVNLYFSQGFYLCRIVISSSGCWLTCTKYYVCCFYYQYQLGLWPVYTALYYIYCPKLAVTLNNITVIIFMHQKFQSFRIATQPKVHELIYI